MEHSGERSKTRPISTTPRREGRRRSRGFRLYFTRAAIPFVRPGNPRPTFWKHIGLYVYRRDFLLKLASMTPTALERAEGLEQLRVLENGFRIATVETDVDTIGVDTPADLAKVRELIEARTISPGVTCKPEEVSWDRQTDSDPSNTSS